MRFSVTALVTGAALLLGTPCWALAADGVWDQKAGFPDPSTLALLVAGCLIMSLRRPGRKT